MKKYFSHICSNLTDFVKETWGHKYKNNLQMRAAQIGNPPNLEYVYLLVCEKAPPLIPKYIFYSICVFVVKLLVTICKRAQSSPHPPLEQNKFGPGVSKSNLNNC